MTLIPSAHDIEAFDRALSDAADGVIASGAFDDELRVVSSLAAMDARPDAVFSADLRAALVGSNSAPVIALATAQRRPRRRWAMAAPAAAVVLATAGVAAAMTTGIVAGHNPSAPATVAALQAPAASTLTTAAAQLDQVNALLAAGATDASDLNALRADALALQQALLMEYGAHRDPRTIRALHDFATSALSRLAALSDRVPVHLHSLYVSTLQTLLDIAATAEAACPACGLPPVTVPASVAPNLQPASIQPLPPAPLGTIAPVPTVTSVPKPTTPALPTLPAGTEPTTAPTTTPSPTSPSKPSAPAVPVVPVPTLPVSLPTSLF